MRYRFVLSLLAAGLSLSAASAFSAQGAGGGWMHDVDQAMQVATTQQRPVLLFVSMDGCRVLPAHGADNVQQSAGHPDDQGQLRASGRQEIGAAGFDARVCRSRASRRR